MTAKYGISHICLNAAPHSGRPPGQRQRHRLPRSFTIRRNTNRPRCLYRRPGIGQLRKAAHARKNLDGRSRAKCPNREDDPARSAPRLDPWADVRGCPINHRPQEEPAHEALSPAGKRAGNSRRPALTQPATRRCREARFTRPDDLSAPLIAPTARKRHGHHECDGSCDQPR